MNEQLSMLLVMVEMGGVFAPLAFILFHLLRQVFFIPVAIVCVAGGVLFGTFYGTIYSIIGLMLSCLIFYFIIQQMPATHEKLTKLKIKWFGEYRNITVGQVTVLRLIPFIHFHLLNFCLIERKKGFKDYLKNALFSNVPLALFYTVFGEFISRFTPTIIIVILFSLSILVYVLREKITVIKWKEFFKAA